MSLKFCTVLGARPQFIKAAALSREITDRDGMDEFIVHTGQHYDPNMSDVFFEQLQIPTPKYNLGIAGGGHGQMTGRQLEALEQVMLDEKPDCVIVYGDTNSTLAAGLAAAKLHIPVAHIEAGLRSFNKRMPEEINRILTDHLSSYLFPPSPAAQDLLAKEGITHDGVVCSGDIMYDVARIFGERAKDSSDILERLSLQPGQFVLSTIHRQENTDDVTRLEEIFSALRALSADMPVVLPLHPRTSGVLDQTGRREEMTAGITVIDPVSFFDVTRLVGAASLMLTDSGGMQKEAYFHGTRSVVLRDETEWTELLDLGWTTLPETMTKAAILQAAHDVQGGTPDDAEQPYGDGHAAQVIVDTLAAALS